MLYELYLGVGSVWLFKFTSTYWLARFLRSVNSARLLSAIWSTEKSLR
jgi:hypothetical protein